MLLNVISDTYNARDKSTLPTFECFKNKILVEAQAASFAR